MKFFTPYNKATKNLDSGGGRIIVEMTGYRSAQQRIEDILNAGQRLVEHRTAENMFHFAEGEEPDLAFTDPTMDKNWDLADAAQATYATEMRLNAQKKATEALENKKQGVIPPDDTAPVGAV